MITSKELFLEKLSGEDEQVTVSYRSSFRSKKVVGELYFKHYFNGVYFFTKASSLEYYCKRLGVSLVDAFKAIRKRKGVVLCNTIDTDFYASIIEALEKAGWEVVEEFINIGDNQRNINTIWRSKNASL